MARLNANKFTIPTPVQAAAIPPALEGRDVLATACLLYTSIQADHGVGCLAVMAPFEKAMALRAVKHHNAEARGQILALLVDRKVWKIGRKLAGRRNVQARLCHLCA